MYTIGAFSKLCHISPRMLRYYDSLGLLAPARVDPETGYRYYDSAQLGRLERIQRLSAYGFPLSQVEELLDLDAAALARRIRERRLAVYEELARLRLQVRRMEEELLKMEDMDMISQQYHVVLLTEPPRRVLTLRRTIPVHEIHGLFQDLHALAAELGLRRTGPTQSAYLGQEFHYERMDIEAQMEVDGAAPQVKTLPGGLYAAVSHMGPYSALQRAYTALCAWVGEHPEYQVCGPALERYLKDETDGVPPEELETGVMLPVRLCEPSSGGALL